MLVEITVSLNTFCVCRVRSSPIYPLNGEKFIVILEQSNFLWILQLLIKNFYFLSFGHNDVWNGEQVLDDFLDTAFPNILDGKNLILLLFICRILSFSIFMLNNNIHEFSKLIMILLCEVWSPESRIYVFLLIMYTIVKLNKEFIVNI